LKVCPSYSVDLKGLNVEIFGKTPNQYLIGNIISAYLGYSSDENIRFNASSGGLITALLTLALEEKIIDGALVTRMNNVDPLKPESFIAKSKEEIVSAMGSKYCPVPLNKVIKELVQRDGRFALVGLPCHIAGVRKLEKKIPELKEKIVFHLGLFCSHTANFNFTLFLLHLLNIDKGRILELRYRGRGWPGYLTVALKEGEEFTIPYKWYSKFHKLFFFTPIRCMLCPDPLSQLADLSFGDAWIREIMNKDTKGTSICISRTAKGEELLEMGVQKGKVILKKMTYNQVMEILPSMFRLRRIKVMENLLRKKIPFYNIDLPNPRILDYIVVIIYFFNNVLAKHKTTWPFIPSLSSLEQRLLHVLSAIIK